MEQSTSLLTGQIGLVYKKSMLANKISSKIVQTIIITIINCEMKAKQFPTYLATCLWINVNDLKLGANVS